MESPTSMSERTSFVERVEPLPVDWEKRCKTLEGQLEKFKTQATKIRETIGQQVKHLKWQAETSEAVAARASQQVKDLECAVATKGEEIKTLERKLEDEKQRSNYREKQVEQKSKYIKDWMSNKVEQYEKDIRALRAQNAELQISRDKALEVVQEMQLKLRFSEGQVLRLSKELSTVNSDHQENDYYVLEPEDPSESSENETVPSSNHVTSTKNGMTNGTLATNGETSSCDDVTSPPPEVTSPFAEVTSPGAPMIVTTTPSDTTETFFGSESNPQLYASVNVESILQEADSSSDRDQPVEINIKRTSSGKSPSKIPRYVGNVKDHRGQVSYYMSLKKGAPHSPENDPKPRFFIQVQDNPYMTLMPGPSTQSTPGGSRTGSQSTMDSEHEGGVDSHPQSPGESVNGLTAQTGNVVTLTFDTRKLSKDSCDEVALSSLHVDSLEPTVDPNPIYQVLERPEDSSSPSETPRSSPVQDPTAKSETPRGSPTQSSASPQNGLFLETPVVPPRFIGPEQLVRPPVPPVPKYRRPEEQGGKRALGGFTSYLPPEEVTGGAAAPDSDTTSDAQSVNIDSAIIAEQLKHQAWGWNTGRAGGTDSPQYATLEDSTKNMNMLKEKTCPVYATLKGRASQIRDVPFSGESTDSSDDNRASFADYCEPPDDDSDGEITSGKVLKTCATYTTVSLKKEDQHKEGYLTKLGGRVKNWKRRWFVLQDGKLYYYKSPSDVNRKPLGQIPLDGTCRIARTEGAVTFQIATPKRTYYLTADSSEVVIEWLRVLHNVMRTLATTPLFAQVKEKEVMRGWVTRSKHGVSKRCWCVLRGKFLCFYKLEDDAVPFSMMDISDMTVEEFETQDDGDASAALETQYRHYSLVLRTRKHATQTFLLVDSRADKDTWLYHLRQAAGGGLGSVGTEFERLVTRIAEDNNQSDPDLWNNPLLTFSKDAITEPLTSLPSKELEQEAVKLFKSILLFTKAAMDEAAIDYHVSLVQNALQVCLDHADLQNEIYCQLIKQTSKHVYNGPQDLNNFLQNCGKSSWLRTETVSSSTSECQTIDLRPVQSHVFMQTWQLLALCTALFAPRGKFLPYLKAHLNRCRNLKTKQGKYSAYCLRSLERTLANGNREARPSRMEVLSVLLRNPYDHSCPMSIPVYFIDRSNRVFGFDGSTTVEEFTASINRITGIRDVSRSGYAIFTDNPVSPVEHCLQTSVKLCDVISKWEQALRSLGQGRLDSTRIMRLTYKNRLYFKSLQDKEADKEKYFLVYQTNYNIMKGRFAVSKDMALELASLMGQIEYGDYRAPSNSLPSKRIEMVISKYYPKKLRDDTENSERRSLTLRMAEKWSMLHGWNVKECVDKYLENARKWPFFGCKVFRAEQKNTLSSSKRTSVHSQNSARQPVCLAVEEDSVNILEGESLRLMCRYKYRNVVTFGGWKDDFMLVVNQSIMRGGNHVEQGTQRLLFEMSRGKILEITLLMASYINAIVRQQGITCDLSGGPNSTKDVKVWDLESSEWPILPGSNVGLL